MPTHLPPSILIHLAAASWVLVIGAVQLARPKGTPSHRMLGRSWMLAMVVAAVASFWMRHPGGAFLGYGPIHLLSVWVLICVVVSTLSARRGDLRRHQRFAIGAYIGTIVALAGAVLFPGRLLYRLVFG